MKDDVLCAVIRLRPPDASKVNFIRRLAICYSVVCVKKNTNKNCHPLARIAETGSRNASILIESLVIPGAAYNKATILVGICLRRRPPKLIQL